MKRDNNAIRIAVLCDLHFGYDAGAGARRTAVADILLAKAIHRLNEVIRPDVTVVLGDLLDAGSLPGAAARREALKGIMGDLESPVIIIPGNHDGDPREFYGCFFRPGEMMDIAGARFLPFVDRDEPGWNASRSAFDVERPERARAGFNGPIVTLQHVCLAPPDPPVSPYNYTNAAEIIPAMQRAGVILSISGHHHAGLDDVVRDGITFVNAPALCEPPFRFKLVTIRGGNVSSETHQLAMPAGLGLRDWHIHTQFAYCARDMEVRQTLALVADLGLAGIGFVEHSGQLYFDKECYWSGRCHRKGLGSAAAKDNRVEQFFGAVKPHAGPGVRIGLEVDCDYRGNLLVNAADAERCDYLIGAVHRLQAAESREVSAEEFAGEFAFLVESMLGHGMVDVLAHPFRMFGNAGIPVPPGLYERVVGVLRRTGTAAEINFHGSGTSDEFVKMCIEGGVKLALASDSHSPWEIGELARHLELIRRIGFNGDLADVLFGVT